MTPHAYARAQGLDPRTVLRAIRDGRLAATQRPSGRYEVAPTATIAPAPLLVRQRRRVHFTPSDAAAVVLTAARARAIAREQGVSEPTVWRRWRERKLSRKPSPPAAQPTGGDVDGTVGL